MFSSPQKGFIQHHFSKKKSGAGFTLIELLVVIGILAVLATTTALILNPAELLAQSRDTKRINDLNSLNSAINLYQVQGGVLASSNIVYISLPDSSPTCANWPNLPTLPQSPVVWTYSCASNPSSTTNGWIPINFTNIAGVTLAALPVDPVNSPTDLQYYTFIKGSWNLTARLESNKLIKATALNDGGSDPLRYEEGSDKSLGSKATGLVGYWPMDEGSGVIGSAVSDLSGSGNGGVINGTSNLTPTSSCKVGACLRFDGVNQYITAPDSPSLNNNSVTVSLWFTLTSDPECDGNNNWRSLIKKSASSAGTTTGWDVVMEQGKGIVFDVGLAGVTSRTTNVNIGVDVGVPVFLTFTYSATTGNQNVYANGVSKILKTNLPTNIATNTSPFTISKGSNAVACPNQDGYSPGIYDDVRIYNRALSASEIQAIYNATK